jgi:shikimate kinase
VTTAGAAAILLTGMSGTGKSTLLAELASRGHRVVDTDDGGRIEEVELPGGGHQPMWREPRIAALLAEPRDGPLFVAGCVANQGRFSTDFAAIVLLSVPGDVLLERLATRTTNDFGKTEAQRERILADVQEVEPLLRAAATVEIDTRHPVEETTDMLEAIAFASV